MVSENEVKEMTDGPSTKVTVTIACCHSGESLHRHKCGLGDLSESRPSTFWFLVKPQPNDMKSVRKTVQRYFGEDALDWADRSYLTDWCCTSDSLHFLSFMP